jgi:hypothetical protein
MLLKLYVTDRINLFPNSSFNVPERNMLQKFGLPPGGERQEILELFLLDTTEQMPAILSTEDRNRSSLINNVLFVEHYMTEKAQTPRIPTYLCNSIYSETLILHFLNPVFLDSMNTASPAKTFIMAMPNFPERYVGTIYPTPPLYSTMQFLDNGETCNTSQVSKMTFSITLKTPTPHKIF